MRRGLRGLLALLALAWTVAGRASAAPPETEYAGRAREALGRDAEDLRRVARWGDANGLERTADADWRLSLAFDPGDETARRRLHFLRREGAWIRDEASWALARSRPDAQPARADAYAARRRAEFEEPAAARHRDLATWCRAAGLAAEADTELRTAVERDPDDVLLRLAVGEVPDPADGFVPAPLRSRRVAGARAAAEVARLSARNAVPVREAGVSARSAAAGARLSVWRLREWRLETSLPDEDAARVLALVDLGARWFRARFGIEAGARVLPGEGVFVVVHTVEAYAKVIAAEPGLPDAERAFAATLSGWPVPHLVDRGPWVVVLGRYDAAGAADACLHYAMHFLFQARYRVEAKEAWLYEGLASYATLRVNGSQASWCIRLEETRSTPDENRTATEPEWGLEALVLAHRRDDFPMKGLVGASLNGLSLPMLVKSWSVLRWLLEDRPEEGVRFLEAHWAGAPSEAALRFGTGLPLDEVDAAWRTHVLATEGE